MYKALLILKYLRKRRIAWVSLVAVMLCTALVLVVISVMGGWLAMFRTQFKGLSGDLIVRGESLAGFPHYQEMIDEVRTRVPEVSAAVPVIRSFALINVENQIRKGVEIVGFPPDIQEVNAFRSSLYRLGGNHQGVLVRAEDAPELLKAQDPEAAAAARPLPSTRPAAGSAPAAFGLISGGKFLPFSATGNRRAIEYLSMEGAVPRVHARMIEVTPLKVTAFNEPDGKIEGHLVSLRYAVAVMANDDPDEAAAHMERRDGEFATSAWGLVSKGRYYRFDLEGTLKAARHMQSAGGSRKVRVSGEAGPVEYEVDALSRGDRLELNLWPHANYTPPLRYRGPDVRTWPGIAVGAGVVGLRKDKRGNIIRPPYLYDAFVDVTVLPIGGGGSLDGTEKTRRFYWIVDDSRTRVHLVDSNTVYVPFDLLQKDLQMDGGPDGEPPRTSDIQIALRPGSDARALKEKVKAVVDEVARRRGVNAALYEVQTWEETYATFLGAVEKEKGLLTLLFSFISIVAVFLIFCIFYMIVVEKTRDIGILKSVGATSGGVAAIFLGYGAAIGVVGSGLGLALAYLIVRNINYLHELIDRVTGQQIWNPEVYLFDTIPNTMNPREVAVILAVAVVASVLGALVPAIRAARMHPVEALRWE